MASLQTNAVSSSPNAANAALKASLQPAASDNGDFAAMLKSDTPPPAPKSEAPAKTADIKPAAPHNAAPHVKAKADNKTADKTDKPDHKDKDTAKTKDTADAKTDPAKPATAPAPQPQAADADADSDTAEANADVQGQAAANQNAPDPTAAQAAAQPQPAQPPQPDASVQAQQMLAAASPVPGAQAAPTAANDNTNVTGAAPAAKGSRAQPQRTPAPQDVSNTPSTDAATAPAKATPGTTPDFLKAAGHQDTKIQAAAAAKADAAQPALSADMTTQAATPAPQTPPAPVPANVNANVVGVTAASPLGAAQPNTIAANTGLGTSVHVGAQGPTPNVNSLAVEIAARSQSGSKEFQIRLDPPELGHVEVRLSIDASGKAEAHMTADHQNTLDLLQKNSPTLTSALRDAGLDVSQSGLNFSLKGQDRQSGDANSGGHSRGTSLAATKTIDAAQSASLSSANPYLSSAGDARLDIHV